MPPAPRRSRAWLAGVHRRQPVAHLDDQPLGGLAADARDARQRGRILRAARSPRRLPRSMPERIASAIRGPTPETLSRLRNSARSSPLAEAVEHVRVLAHHQVRQQLHSAGRAAADERRSTSAPRARSRRRRPRAAVRRRLQRQHARERTDHVRTTGRAPARDPVRAGRRDDELAAGEQPGACELRCGECGETPGLRMAQRHGQRIGGVCGRRGARAPATSTPSAPPATCPRHRSR